MKIIEDKITKPPPLGLTKADVRVILEAVPADWISGIKEIRLANTLSPGIIALLHSGTLTIYPRRADKSAVISGLLKELARNALGWSRGMGILNQADHEKLAPMIKPYYDEIASKIARPAEAPKISLAGFRELKLNKYSADESKVELDACGEAAAHQDMVKKLRGSVKAGKNASGCEGFGDGYTA